jgi:hypothetical protein
VPLPSRPIVTFVSPENLGGVPSRVLIEGQYINPKASKRSLVTLSFGAGVRLGEFPLHVRYRAEPNDWKQVLWPGSMRKEQHQARIRANLLPREIELLDGVELSEALDAVGIMWALHLAAERTRQKWLWKQR